MLPFIMAGHCIHATGNKSKDITREVMTIIYFADGAEITEPKNKHQENDRQTWLAGLQPDYKKAVSSLIHCCCNLKRYCVCNAAAVRFKGVSNDNTLNFTQCEIERLLAFLLLFSSYNIIFALSSIYTGFSKRPGIGITAVRVF